MGWRKWILGGAIGALSLGVGACANDRGAEAGTGGAAEEGQQQYPEWQTEPEDISGAPDTNTGGEGINSGLGHTGTTGSTGNSYGGSGSTDTRSTGSTAGAAEDVERPEGVNENRPDPEYGAPSVPDTGEGRHSYGPRPGELDEGIGDEDGASGDQPASGPAGNTGGGGQSGGQGGGASGGGTGGGGGGGGGGRR